MPPSEGLEGECPLTRERYAFACTEVTLLDSLQGAPRLHEFVLRVRHRDDEFSSRIYFHLHIKYVSMLCREFSDELCRRLPKTYPTLATPIFQIRQPLAGLKPPDIATLTRILNIEAQKLKGTESVFQVRASMLSIWCSSTVLDLSLPRATPRPPVSLSYVTCTRTV